MAHIEDFSSNQGEQGQGQQSQAGARYWRSLDELAQTPEFLERMQREFPQGAAQLEVTPGVDRRRFLGVIGASMGLAGMTLSGCIRKPKEKILPYAVRPEDLVEGEPMQFATALNWGGSVLGLLVTSFDGRPVKIEGNPQHPSSLGATTPWAQASVLDVYDPDRSREPLHNGQGTDFKAMTEAINAFAQGARGGQGTGLGLLVEATPSPTFRRLVDALKRNLPQATVYVHDPLYDANGAAALGQLGLTGAKTHYDFSKADVVCALDSDFLGVEGDVVRNSKQFSAKRRVVDEASTMNRLYVVEGYLTNTGLMADNRLALRPSEIGEFTLALASELAGRGVKLPANVDAKARGVDARGKPYAKWVAALATDLAANRGKSVLAVGHAQPAWVHGVVLALNEGLGNIGTTVRVANDVAASGGATLGDLVAALNGGKVTSLVIVGGNPVFTAPADLGFAEALRKAQTSIHLSFHLNETSKSATWHIPRAHALESWGDLRSDDGTAAIVQPLIEPLFNSWMDLELLARLVGGESDRPYELVQATWKGAAGAGFEKAWRKWLHDGVIPPNVAADAPPAANFQWAGLDAALAQVQPAPVAGLDALEVLFTLDRTILDGRYANNAWLMELPDTVAKLSWDNAAIMSRKTAEALGVKNEDMIEITLRGRTLPIVVWEVAGTADNTIVLPLGYGQDFGRVTKGVGFNTGSLRSSEAPGFDVGAKVAKLGRTYPIATTQEHGSHENRPIIREATLAQYKRDPNYVLKAELISPSKQKTLLWVKPNQITGQQWGMSVDLNTCTGCNACVVACQAENNISVVGKERVRMNREMYWIRIDRYFTGDVDNPSQVSAVTQPMLCQHCETAPCEQVCPVGATVHSPEGLNDMAYNRCIGTRYCANNCPYKVRRFNYFNFSKENDEMNPLYAMQKNPNVTVRFRGVIEKCTYCVQRINQAKIEAKRNGDGKVADGRIVTACQAACPTDTIVFGDVNDPNTLVSKIKSQSRNFAVLGELATQPRTTYLAKLRNPNPELV